MLALVAAAFLVAVAWLIISYNHKPAFLLSDGSRLTYRGMTVGTNHSFHFGNVFQRLAWKVPFQPVQRYGAKGRTGLITSASYRAIPWFSRIRGKEPASKLWVRFVDDHGLSGSHDGLGIYFPIGPGLDAGAVEVSGWPTRSRRIQCQIYEQVDKPPARLVGTITLRNPMRRQFSQWTPGPLPLYPDANGFGVTLEDFHVEVQERPGTNVVRSPETWSARTNRPSRVSPTARSRTNSSAARRNPTASSSRTNPPRPRVSREQRTIVTSLVRSTAAARFTFKADSRLRLEKLFVSTAAGETLSAQIRPQSHATNGELSVEFPWYIWPRAEVCKMRTTWMPGGDFATNETFVLRGVPVFKTGSRRLPMPESILPGGVVEVYAQSAGRTNPSIHLTINGVHPSFNLRQPEFRELVVISAQDNLGRECATGIARQAIIPGDAETVDLRIAIPRTIMVEFVVQPKVTVVGLRDGP